jgi:hypothetical protein
MKRHLESTVDNEVQIERQRFKLNTVRSFHLMYFNLYREYMKLDLLIVSN